MRKNFSSAFLETPSVIVEERKEICKCDCSVDFSDPCAYCPKKNWQPFFCYEIEENQTNKENNFPEITEQVSNFFLAAKKELKSIMDGEGKISEQEKNKRYLLCESCEFFDSPSKRCKKCGCFLKIKTGMRGQHCPIGKW
jgi:hypothetical protein